MAAINGAAARLKDTGKTRPVISASTMVDPSRWRAVSPLGLRRHGPNGSKPVTNTFIKTSHCKTVYLIDCTVFWAVWIRSQAAQAIGLQTCTRCSHEHCRFSVLC